MGRKATGENKIAVTITIKPSIWATFQALTKEKLSMKSSTHMEELVIKEIEVLSGRKALITLSPAQLGHMDSYNENHQTDKNARTYIEKRINEDYSLINLEKKHWPHSQEQRKQPPESYLERLKRSGELNGNMDHYNKVLETNKKYKAYLEKTKNELKPRQNEVQPTMTPQKNAHNRQMCHH
jgi:DNA-binding cell septation regulator SpoVG